ncbi:glycosyltransferase family 9 protein [Pseudobdellovibrio exovorus]|uniref:Heptosyltransferase n=1 Tax=Pseudobdellovibrio exovorus JSS TaxID=1184267 RepID=M4V6Q1_9BACT|nr:glycosyltransferase family 9 protein [Pseudobdellovibrio exovorus]AGH94883.1 hypothetical protein A11Q_663 [Pseudobdellovibrio exovorus JSS]
MKKKVLLIRLDKIGDLICSLPADQVLDSSEYDVTWIIQKGLGSVVDLGEKPRKYFELDKKDPKTSAKLLRELLQTLKPDIAISLQGPWWVNFELFKARVPIRSGVKSQWHSFLFLNKGIRQKRSLAVKHELEYNLDLVQETLDIPSTKEFHYFEIKKPEASHLLSDFGLVPKKYVVVHPGMMGSAQNWPQSEYIKLIQRLTQKGHSVVVTGTAQDEPYLDQIKAACVQHPQVIWLQSKLNLNQLVEVLAYAEYVIVPSTGVAHLAAGVGTLVKGLYSPITVQHPRRWAPRGPDVEVFMLPEVNAECF